MPLHLLSDSRSHPAPEVVELPVTVALVPSSDNPSAPKFRMSPRLSGRRCGGRSPLIRNHSVAFFLSGGSNGLIVSSKERWKGGGRQHRFCPVPAAGTSRSGAGAEPEVNAPGRRVSGRDETSGRGIFQKTGGRKNLKRMENNFILRQWWNGHGGPPGELCARRP